MAGIFSNPDYSAYTGGGSGDDYYDYGSGAGVRDDYYDYGSGSGSSGGSTDYSNEGRIYTDPSSTSTSSDTGGSPANASVEKNLPLLDVNGSGIDKLLNSAKGLFTDKDGNINWAKLATLGAGLAAASKSNRPSYRSGYQGSIPKYTAERMGGNIIYKRADGTVVNPNRLPPAPAPATAAPAKYSSADINNWLGQHAGASDLDIANAMKQYGVTPEQMATATGLQAADVTKRYNTALGLAKGGLASNGFVVPADVVSHFGNGSTNAGLRLLSEKYGATPIHGKGDGMSDSIKTHIDGKQEARVADGEAFISPEMVARLGGGDTKKGAQKLYAMLDRVREARTGNAKQGREINPSKYMPGGSVGYAAGGVPSFDGTTGSTPTLPAGTTGVDQGLATWAGDYVTDMLGKTAAYTGLAYNPYTGPLTAGPSALQTQAFEGIAKAPTYSAGSYSSGYARPGAFSGTNVQSTYKPVEDYVTGKFDAGTWNKDAAEKYMNPYLKMALDPQIAEINRQQQLANMKTQAQLAGAGAFGGSRQILADVEGQRNAADRIAKTLGEGYKSAYDTALTAYGSDAARNLEAQRALEQSRQYGYGQKTGQAKTMAELALDAAKARELSAQFGYGQQTQQARDAAQAAYQANSLTMQDKQYAAKQGLDLLSAQLAAGNTQHALEQAKIDADKKAFDDANMYEARMLQFQKDMLSGLPISSQTYDRAGTDNLTQFAGGVKTADDLLKLLRLTDSTKTS